MIYIGACTGAVSFGEGANRFARILIYETQLKILKNLQQYDAGISNTSQETNYNYSKLFLILPSYVFFAQIVRDMLPE